MDHHVGPVRVQNDHQGSVMAPFSRYASGGTALEVDPERRSAAAAAQDTSNHHPSRGSLDSAAGWDPHMTEAAAELSHDLRVPLCAVIANLEMLQGELPVDSDRTIAELVGRALRASDRMGRMLEQFMTSHAPGTPTTMPEIDVAEIVQQLVLDSSDLLDSAGAVVETGELPVMRADPDEVYSLLQNLVLNSVKFARPGLPAIVQISARRLADSWRIIVRDNGVGLPDDSGVDVFSLFSRGSGAVTGHGIGLATVARIVAAHGGRVGVAPVATGAEIWFELPDADAGQ